MTPEEPRIEETEIAWDKVTPADLRPGARLPTRRKGSGTFPLLVCGLCGFPGDLYWSDWHKSSLGQITWECRRLVCEKCQKVLVRAVRTMDGNERWEVGG